LFCRGLIVGFPYDSNRDWGVKNAHGRWGMPHCKDWWSQPEAGLYDRLKAQIDPGLWNKIISKKGRAADAAIKQLISVSLSSGYRDGTNEAESAIPAMGLGTGLISDIGLFWHSISYFPKMYVMIELLPLIQAYLLMACYIFLALALPASNYRFGTVMSLSAVIFSIIFWSYLWQLATYVDSAMLQALSPIGGFTQGSQFYGGTPGLTNMVAVLMYLIIPAFWTMFMGWAGIQIGNGATSMLDRTSNISEGSGAAAGTLAKGVATKLIKRI
jgi:hypothetical protein